MGSIVRLCPVVTTQMHCMMKLVLVLSLAMVATRAAPQLPPGVNPAACPNYPFCGPSPQGAPSAPAQPQVPGLAAHAAAERAVIAQQSFTGLVGPSGNIGPSGLCGPSGCVQF